MIKKCIVCDGEFEAHRNVMTCSEKCRTKRLDEQKRKHRIANRESYRDAVLRYRSADPEKYRKMVRQHHAANVEKLREQKRQRYRADPEKHCDRSRQYRVENYEQCRTRENMVQLKKTAAIRYLEKLNNSGSACRRDRETQREYYRKWYEKNREKVLERHRQQYKQSRERKMQRAAKRTAALKIVKQLQQGIMP